jgi:putative oxidoreductase
MFGTPFTLYPDWGLLILRIALGVVFIAHGWPKLNPNGPMKGPAGFAAGLKQMGIPLPLFFAWVVALLETAGAVLLILGLGTCVLAIGLTVNMLVATFRALLPAGATFTSMMGGPRWEEEFLLAAGSLALFLTGAGAISLDSLLGIAFPSAIVWFVAIVALVILVFLLVTMNRGQQTATQQPKPGQS